MLPVEGQKTAAFEVVDALGDAADGRASLVVVTHTAPDAALSATVEALAAMPIVRAVDSVMRVEGF